MKGVLDLSKLDRLPPAEREKSLEALKALEAYRQENPLWYYNHPLLSDRPVHIKQMFFHALQQRGRAFFGGNQSGKTTAGIADDLIQAYDWEAVPEHLHFVKRFEPPFYCRMYTTDFKTLELTFIPKLRELIAPSQLAHGKWSEAYSKVNNTLLFANGSMFQFVTYKQDVADMGGVTIDRVHFDEEPPYDHFEESMFRIMRRGGDWILTMTPLKGLTWTWDAIWQEKGQAVIEGELWEGEHLGVVLVDIDDNPYLSEEDKEYALEGLSEEAKQARKRGMFVHFSGLIYGEFDRQKHVVSEFANGPLIKEHASNLNIIVGIDPGISTRHKCAVEWCALTPDDTLFVFDEIYVADTTIEEVCNQIHRINAEWGVMPIYYVIDPKVRTRNMQTGRSDALEFSDHGIVPISGQNDVQPGINRVKERLRDDKIKIFDTCKNLINEMERYRWKDPPRTGEDGAQKPVKTDDHALDALRYVVMSRPYLPQYEVKNRESPLERAKRLSEHRTAMKSDRHEFGGRMIQ